MLQVDALSFSQIDVALNEPGKKQQASIGLGLGVAGPPMSTSRLQGIQEVQSVVSRRSPSKQGSNCQAAKGGAPAEQQAQAQAGPQGGPNKEGSVGMPTPSQSMTMSERYKEAVDELSAALSGTESDKLVIVDVIGQGGFGKVWRAKWRGLVRGPGRCLGCHAAMLPCCMCHEG